MTAVSFTWSTTEPDEYHRVYVREKLDGTDMVNEYGPIHARYVESFIRARRDVVSRFMSRHDALRIFEPRPQLLNINKAQGKPRYDTEH